MVISPPIRRAILIGVALAFLISISPNRGDFPSTADLVRLQQARLEGDSLEEWALLSRLVSRWPHAARIWERMGMLDQSNGMCDQAIQEFHMASLYGRLSDESRVPYAKCLMEAGRYQATIVLLEPTSLARSHPPDIERILLRAYLRNGQGDAALDFAKQWSSREPTNAEAHFSYGLILALSDTQTALAEMRYSSKLDPAFTHSSQQMQTAINKASLSNDRSYGLVEIGRAYGSLGEWELAEYAFWQASVTNPAYAEAYAWLGEARQHLGGSGIEEFQKALALDPESILVQALNSLRLQRSGEVNEAISILETIAAEEPDNFQWPLFLGQVYAISGDLATALTTFERAIALAPKDANTWQALADFSFTYQYEIDTKGIPAAIQALALSSEDAHSLDLICQSKMYQNDLVSAKSNCNEAILIDPEYAPAHYHLALILIQDGELDKAIRQLEKAADLGSREAQSLLDQLKSQMP